MDAGVIPVKRLSEAKKRLGEHFSDAGRYEIACALVEDALELAKTCGFLHWWIVSPDEDVLSMARTYGFSGLKDRHEGLNAALRQAIEVVGQEGATSVTMIPSDVPLAYRDDIRDLYDTGVGSEVVLVPAGRDGGTNGLYMRPPELLAPRFGTASLQGHLALAERLGHRCSILVLPRLALDLDTMDDVQEFLKRDKVGNTKTSQVLKKLQGA
jgi:2-phospho-L-lactate guanylyltransferase